ncbi:MAG: hypothetical protein GEU82_13820 [Luteitalea sp.]|nr:hypothetical protein [Luteitalea sp.]
MPPHFLTAIVVLGLGLTVGADAQDLRVEAPSKRARAVRVVEGAIRVDGTLDDEAWRTATPVVDFVQKEPIEGAAPTDRMEVRFAYDDVALYVGARMFSTAAIQTPMGRRDEGDQAEHLRISLDTYFDRRTSSTFGVTASGVRLDHYYSSDDGFNDDPTFTPVWRARTAVDGQGWTAELWIPFAQLRFNDRTPQVWGLNIQRWVPSRNEEVFWALIGRTDERWASLFGELHGIDGIRPGRRIELLPYVASTATALGRRDPNDPFKSAVDLNGRVGADIKVGLGSNLTLEATMNPDFGQVEADPAEVNLSAFETFFDERRPFFVDGANLLTGNVNNYFYSRRIGAAPLGEAQADFVDAQADFVDAPGTTTILGAAKLTGRLASGTSIGVLGAVTGEESARTFSGSQFGRVMVAPPTAYAVGRIEQEFGPPGSTVGLMATSVNRQLSPNDPLSSLLTRNAVTFSGDSVVRFGDYEMQGYLGVTHVDGDPGAILRLQHSSARYFQRPDVDYVRLDPLRRSMSGAKGGVEIERQNGRHWLWSAETSFETPGFETNDVGRLTTGDGRLYNTELEYRETVPGRWFREYSVALSQGQEWNFGGDLQVSTASSEAEITWPNFWSTRWTNELEFRRQDMRLTRGGPSMERPGLWRTGVEIETSEASQTRGDAEVLYGRDEDGGLLFRLNTGMTVQPGPRWQLSLSPSYQREVDTQQYVATLPGGGPATFGGRYIFGHVDRSTYSTQVRLNYTFKPDLNLDFYGEPFAASGIYDRYGELTAARTRLLRPVDPASIGSADFSVRSFRSNLVLRWEWRAGSTLYLVWQQNREIDEALRSRATVGDMFGSLSSPGDNFFAVKASFWFSPQ